MIGSLLDTHLESASDRLVIHELEGRSYSLHELREHVAALADRLTAAYGNCDGLVVGVAMRSSFQWVVAMLAVLRVRGVLLPVPIEFSDEQIASLLGKASGVFVGEPHTARRLARLLPDTPQLHATAPGGWPSVRPGERVEAGLYAIIHTSGTTSRPKGVKIRRDAIGVLARHVMQRVPPVPLHGLSVVPMSLLIEQVLGVFLPLLSGGSLTLMPAGTDEYGARSGNARDYLDLIARAQPNFLYLPPKLLEEAQVLLRSRSAASLLGPRKPHIITGGAKIGAAVLTRLDEHGVHVYEAYGLSENSSIVSMNFPGHRRIGSVGTLLDGVEARWVEGELHVKTPTLCAGYYNADDTACALTDGFLHTGDLGEMRDGYLHITGRKKHVIILSTARNISPEWVESVYKESPLIDDLVVMGEGREEPVAVVLSAHSGAAIRADMSRLDHRLAAYARVRKVLVVADIDAFRNDYYTVTGRPRRQQIENAFASARYE